MPLKQTRLRTDKIEPNENKTVPIGTIKAVEFVFDELRLDGYLDGLKRCGHSLSSLIKGAVAYKLTENFSVNQCSAWMNDDVIRDLLELEEFNRSAMYRTLDVLGRNRNEILFHVRKMLMRSHGIDLKSVIMDWTSVHFEAEVSSILRFGHSRDHRPDRPQVTVGVVQDGESSIPVGMTILPGNINDQEHFKFTYGQVRDDLETGSRVIFDAGAHGKPNVDMLVEDGMRYLSRMKLNASDELRIARFKKDEWELIDAEDGVYGKKLDFPSRTKYLYFSRKLREDIVSRKRSGLERRYEEATRRSRSRTGGRPVLPRCCQNENSSACFLIASSEILYLRTMTSSWSSTIARRSMPNVSTFV